MNRNERVLSLSDHTRVELLLREDGLFEGLGDIRVRGVPLRDGAVPLRFRLDTHDGILYTQLRLRGTKPLPDGGHELQLDALGLPWGRGEIHDDYGQAVLYPARDDTPVRDDLRIELRPLRHTLAGREWTGFSYRLRFHSETRQVHRALVHATWELGGRITGNTLLCPGQCNRPVWRGAQQELFTSACLRALHLYGHLHGNSFQLGPRAGMCQAFDFQHGPDGALLGFWPEFDGLSSLIESRPGEDVLHVLDEYRLPLSNDLISPAKWILFTPGNLPEHEARDLWWDLTRSIHADIRGQFGLEASRMFPEGPYHHGFMNIYSTRIHAGRLQMALREGQWVDHTEVLDAYVDQVFPRLVELGFRRFKPEVVQECDVTEIGMRRKLDGGIHGDLHCASVCATHRHRPSDFWGGMAAWRRMYEGGRALGLEIGHWMAPHMSPRAAIFEDHPEFRVIDALGFPAGGGYGFQTLVVADWNGGFADWAFDNLKRWKDEGGLDYLWVDSYSNLGMVQMNYADRMRTQFSGFARFLARLQQAGIGEFYFESMPALGCPSFGMADLQGAALAQRKDVAGQNDFGWWAEEPDMICDMHINLGGFTRGAAESERLQFQAMASRGMIFFQELAENGGFVTRDLTIPDWWRKNNRVFNRAEPFMRGTRRLLPDRAGVVWHAGGDRCIWTFSEVCLTLEPGATVGILHGSDPQREGGVTRFPAQGVYTVSNRRSGPSGTLA